MYRGSRVYITIPPELADSAGSFPVNPSIPLPVELPEAETVFRPETLNLEMILSGILLELAENPEGNHAAYYRALAASLRPEILVELTGAAMLKSRNGDHEDALEITALLEGLYPCHPSVLLARARITEALKHGTAPDKAEAAWESALAVPLPDTLFYAGLFYHAQGEYRRAAELFGLYCAKNEDEDDEGKHQKARKLLEEIRINGLDDETFLDACALIRSGNNEQGILKAKDFLERRPRTAKGWFVLGWGLRRLSRWEDGAACFEKAAALGLTNADTKNELAICLMETGHYDKARRELESALREDPGNIKVISNLGVLALQQGREDEASAFFRAVLEFDPKDLVALSFLERT
jgi:tetratricopeptide (TPR) repeat protein